MNSEKKKKIRGFLFPITPVHNAGLSLLPSAEGGMLQTELPGERAGCRIGFQATAEQ